MLWGGRSVPGPRSRSAIDSAAEPQPLTIWAARGRARCSSSLRLLQTLPIDAGSCGGPRGTRRCWQTWHRHFGPRRHPRAMATRVQVLRGVPSTGGSAGVGRRCPSEPLHRLSCRCHPAARGAELPVTSISGGDSGELSHTATAMGTGCPASLSPRGWPAVGHGAGAAAGAGCHVAPMRDTSTHSRHISTAQEGPSG